MTAAVIEPFGFFTWDSLRAGWFLTWRVFVRILLAAFVLGIVAALLIGFGGAIGGVLTGVLGLAVIVWTFTLVPRIASQWAEQRYGQPLEHWFRVWWGITWRTFVVSLVVGVILGVPYGVAGSLVAAYKTSALGVLGGSLIALLTVANFVVSIVTQGWAMSRVTAAQLGGAEPMAPTWMPESEPAAPVAEAPPSVTARAPAPRAAPTAAPVPSTGGKRQCPKCGLYETERGSVIGWYCRVCGWREARR